MILKSVVPTGSSLGGYLYIITRFVQLCTYPHIFQMLVYGSGKPISSSSNVYISRAEGVKCLFCKAGVAKSGPPVPMIHGAFTSEFVTDTSYESSVEGQSSVTPASASILKAGFGIWLVEG